MLKITRQNYGALSTEEMLRKIVLAPGPLRHHRIYEQPRRRSGWRGNGRLAKLVEGDYFHT